MNAQQLLQEIADYCRHTGLAESTFGRRAVNDGKLTARLRNGGRITTETFDRIRAFIDNNQIAAAARPTVIERAREPRRGAPPPSAPPAGGQRDPQRNFRFFDNRQKYLLFVNTCSEKWVIASRVALELANVHPRPPALRSTSRRSCWCSIAPTTSSCSTRSFRGPAAPWPTMIWSSPRSRTGRAPRLTSRPSA